jgi:hypothetical protein
MDDTTSLVLGLRGKSDPLLDLAMRLTSRLTSADLAYVEILESRHVSGVRMWGAHGADEIDLLAALPRDLLKGALREQHTKVSADGRHLCALVHLQGFIYLRSEAGFSPGVREAIEPLAHVLGTVTARMISPPGEMKLAEQVGRLRRHRILEALDRHHLNVTRVSLELGVARSHVYKLLRSARKTKNGKQ